jgi:hypothetical protein
MPSFTFEKISVRGAAVPSTGKKRRGLIAQLLDRLLQARLKRKTRREKRVIARRPGSPVD